MTQAIFWTTQKSYLEEDFWYLNLYYEKLKSEHWWIFGKSWSWKTYALISLLFWTIKNSLIEQSQANNKNYADTYIIIDPHNSTIEPLLLLLDDYFKENIKLSRVMETTRYKKYLSDWKNKQFRSFYMDKKLLLNPLFSLKLIEDIDYLEVLVNFNMSSLKGIFDFSAFWPTNTQCIEWLIRTFILINVELYKNDENTILYSYKDIFLFLDYISKNQRLPNYINQVFTNIFNSSNPKIKEIWNSNYEHLINLVRNTKNSPDYYITSFTKLKDFAFELWDTFWYQKNYKELTLDLEVLMKMEKLEVDINLFDLSEYNSNERKVIISFLTNATYHLGLLKNHNNPNIWKHYYCCDEFQSFLELKGSKNYMIDLLEKWLNELRKKRVSYLFVFQSISNELKDLLNNLWYYLVFALPPEQWQLFEELLTNWTQKDIEILQKDIANQQRGSFYASFDTINSWLLTISWKSINFQTPLNKTILFK
jgi:hypothetical protein